MTTRDFICPVCLRPMKQVENDWANRWCCVKIGCFLHSFPVPFDIAKVMTENLVLQRSPWKRFVRWWKGVEG